MEAFLRTLSPRLLPASRTFEVHAFQGKSDLLRKLEARLRGYAQWLPDDWRIVVMVDRDDDDCHVLKQRLDDSAGLTPSQKPCDDREGAFVQDIFIVVVFPSYRLYVLQRIPFGLGGRSHSSGFNLPINRALILAFPRHARSCGASNCDAYATCVPQACRLQNFVAPGGHLRVSCPRCGRPTNHPITRESGSDRRMTAQRRSVCLVNAA